MDFGKQWQGQTAGGRFPLEQYLGGSDSSAVFLTRLQDPATSKAVIKLLPSGPDAEARLADWRRVAQLSHPHMIRIFESGRCWLSGKELLYVVSEYADENLAQVVPQRALNASEADSMLRPMLQALAYLHDRGLVHGRISPTNTLAVADQLKLSSDGIQALGTETRKFQASAYDAPEVAAGILSPAADVWSLGAMLGEALSQRLLEEKAQVAKANLPHPYGEIVGHCLEKDPARRWTVREIAAAIRLDLPSGKPQRLVEKAPAARQPVATRSGSRVLPLFLVLAAVALVIAALLTFKAVYQPVNQQQVASVQPAPPQTQPVVPDANQAPAVLHRVLPSPAASALRTIHGRIKIRVRARVNSGGNVANARFISPGPSKYFARLAMEAAKQWRFTPALQSGETSATEWNLLFEFTRGGVQASAEPAKSSR